MAARRIREISKTTRLRMRISLECNSNTNFNENLNKLPNDDDNSNVLGQLKDNFDQFSINDDDEDRESQQEEISVQDNVENEEKNRIKEIRLVPSLFPNRPATVFFDYPMGLNVVRERTGSYVATIESSSLMFKTHWERNSVKSAFMNAGFTRTKTSRWNASWSKHPKLDVYKRYKLHQKINHFPDSWVIGRKDRMMRTIHAMKRVHPNSYRFLPEGYQLPEQHAAFMKEINRDKTGLWILKPNASSCGRGIRLINLDNVHTIPKQKSMLIQKYISSPYLINQYKFDIRLYVLVTSMNPLRIYLFQDGLVRFCTEKYSTESKDLKNRFSHLTNYCVNVKNSAFCENRDAGMDNDGSKWSLRALMEYFRSQGHDENKILKSMKGVIIKTLIAAEGHIAPLVQRSVPHRNTCYELFGFDLMLDKNLRPWLIEVNISPSLMGTSPLDRKIKGILMSDLYHLIGFIPTPVKDSKGKKFLLRKSRRKVLQKGPLLKPNTKTFPLKGISRYSLDNLSKISFSKDEWDVIYDLEDEMHRKGHFDRIYPNLDSIQEFSELFSCNREYNLVTNKWIVYMAAQSTRDEPKNNNQEEGE